MNSEKVIYILLGICVLLLIYYLFKKQLRHMAINIIFGVLIIYIVNSLFPELKVGINALTIATIGVLGVPGIVILYTAILIL